MSQMKNFCDPDADPSILSLAWGFLSSSQELQELLSTVDLVPTSAGKSHLRGVIINDLAKLNLLVENYFGFTKGEKS